ncbi:MAG: aminotransferase class I/II-fold pyridoxal phosphate-dependent enzyme [Burkholderiales bacterium]|nr:aminotransferase class I/II-fold pyridoxal phosphate-dependent enzyme [Burkholderiales bacterium]
MKSFASDNYSGIAPEIMQAIVDANHEHQPSYGNDIYTKHAQELLQQTFGSDIISYFAYNGTGANSVALKAILRSHHLLICSDISHIATQEVGAASNLTGCSTLLTPHKNGKIIAEDIRQIYTRSSQWGHHGNLPKVVSIAQSTELGTVYTIEELRHIAAVCKEHNLIFHMDGCRLSNAAAFLGCSLAAITRDVGIDVLSFGGTKNGLMFGEVVIFFRPELAEEFSYIHKQSLQLNSKMRFMSAQFIPYLKDKLWFKYANQANQMCQKLAKAISKLDEIKIAYPVETNQLFVHLPQKIIEATQPIYPYYIWEPSTNMARLVTSFDTTDDDINGFISLATT